MSEDHVKDLHTILDNLRETRRTFAKKLAGPYNREQNEHWKERFTETQQLIEIVIAAIKDEESIAPSVYEARGMIETDD